MKENLIIVSPRQYGYQTDYLKYVEYLPLYYNVVFLCLDQGEKHIECTNATIKYVNISNRRLSYIIFMLYAYLYLLCHGGKVMTTNFKGCRYLKKLMPWRKMAVNIRTVSVDRDAAKAARQNALILKDAECFDRIIMISNGGARQLNLPMEKVDVVSLGSDVISSNDKVFDSLRLLYVGTLTNRDMPKTVRGFHEYIKQTGDQIATYDIVGDGVEFDEIKQYIEKNKLQNRIILHGRKAYNELKIFFDVCNVGVSFVPMTEAYEYQPPTKTFEYMNSGLITIATGTRANSEAMSADTGYVIKDTEEDFFQCLLRINNEIGKFNSDKIRKCGDQFLWINIIGIQLISSLNRL